MSEAPTRIYLGVDREEDGQCDLFITAKGFGISYVKESVVDELVAALKYCMRYNGYDFDETPAEAALKRLEDV